MHTANKFARPFLIMYKVTMKKLTQLERIRAKAAKLRYRGITQKQMAEDIGIDVTTLSSILHGRRVMPAIVWEYFLKVRK